ncbi:hypothetical protein SLS55_004667 [Diplodia seriata]|uniref:Uncharacterized protein n=1 Tax=Diplodia seriata TaxID=420778 RepID=A0ABR3CK39_9PEZI
MSTSNFYYGAPHHNIHMNHSQQHHPGGRPRRQPRSQAAHNHKQFRNVRPTKEVVEAPAILAFRRDFEAARSFDLEDDEIFCPFHLLTDDDPTQTKLHQPLAQRTRNAIPIVDPSTRNVASPPPSVSPARQMQQQFMPRRW